MLFELPYNIKCFFKTYTIIISIGMYVFNFTHTIVYFLYLKFFRNIILIEIFVQIQYKKISDVGIYSLMKKY